MKSPKQVKINIHCSSSTPRPIIAVIKKSAGVTLEKLPKNIFRKMTRNLESGNLNIALVGSKKIQKLNKQYRSKNKPTDVLSFSRIETQLSSFLSDNELGDILICLQIAKKQAKNYETTLNQELARLTVHGVLHIFGYDHERSLNDEKTMFKLQEKILKNLLKS